MKITNKCKIMNVTNKSIRRLEIEYDIMLLENQIKNLIKEKDKLVNELERLKEEEEEEKVR